VFLHLLAMLLKSITLCKQVIFRSVIRSALHPTLRQKRLFPLSGEKDASHVGSEFKAARISFYQIVDLQSTLLYLVATVKGQSFMFGDN
jgi:hypothetical protein